ncbi:hypothetical protein HCX49_17600 [Sphingobacterium kitahiroshimense]|uniref:lipopolysaccharide biosynthesis protein n=1 Tax=Sphingobacterium sp. B16(2022) TaxID=2914044 RepID=UPI0014392131|nr:hypothetical protein [Sphingobacterium sp. B16(2022)]NJI75020.1 hypothetical protein [Sphingobacterium sp. B16(2022)]
MINKIKRVIAVVFKNNVVLYLFSRYFTFFLQFLNSLFLATNLGPYYLGIWGFFSLSLQYIAFLNFGIQQSSNNYLSLKFSNQNLRVKITTNALILLSALFVILIMAAFGFRLFGSNFSDKYHFSALYIPLLIAGIMNHLIVFFSNIYRIYGKFLKIAISQSLSVFLTLLVVWQYQGLYLLEILVFIHVASAIISVILFLIGLPIKIKWSFNTYWLKRICIKGLYMFFYNSSFYFMMLATRSFVSTYYEVEEFGYFTFAFTLASTILLLLDSLNYVIYPKILNRFSKMEKSKVVQELSYIRSCYTTCTHFLAHAAIVLFPLFLYLFPKYAESQNAFRLIILTVILTTNAFGISGFIISKGKERNLGLIAFLCLLLNLVCNYILVIVWHVGFEYVILSTGIAYLVYIFVINHFGLTLIGDKLNFRQLLNFTFNIKLLVPYALTLLFIFLNCPNYFYILSFVLFVLLNMQSFKQVFVIMKRLILDPSIFSLK